MIQTFLLEENFLNKYMECEERFLTMKSDDLEKSFETFSGLLMEEPKESAPYDVIDGDAHIVIEGVLKNSEQSFMEWLFDIQVTSYGSIMQRIAHAENNPDVERIYLQINSPGGSVDGLDQTGQMIKATSKKTVAMVHGMAASAAYWLSSQANEIVATSPASLVGSIGVVTTLIDRKESDKKNGIKRITMTSTGAPEKRPDIDSPEGQKIVQRELDQLHAVFARRVAEGRKTTIDDVNDNYGKGSVMTAEVAIKSKMIDRVIEKMTLRDNETTSTSDIGSIELKSEVETMEIKTKADLINAFPNLCAEIKAEGFESGIQKGISQEKTRIAAHGTFADVAPVSVLKNITDGKEFDSVCSAEYQKEMMTKKLASMRTGENADGLDVEGNGDKPDMISGILSRIIEDHGGAK